jgi:ribosomal protein L7/L12
MESFIAVMAAVVVLAETFRAFDLGSVRKEQKRTAARQAAIEAKLDALMAHHGVTLPEARFPAVEQLLLEGKKIEAIKLYRQETGADLVTAKNDVESLATRRGLTAQ